MKTLLLCAVKRKKAFSSAEWFATALFNFTNNTTTATNSIQGKKVLVWYQHHICQIDPDPSGLIITETDNITRQYANNYPKKCGKHLKTAVKAKLRCLSRKMT